MPLVSTFRTAGQDAIVLDWVGHTGRHYRLIPESVSGFQLSENSVHVLVSGQEALWSGSAADVVADPHSRSRFREAMGREVAVYRIEPTPEVDARARASWDIVHGHPAAPLLRAS